MKRIVGIAVAFATGFSWSAYAQPTPPMSERAEIALRGYKLSPDPIECIAKRGGGLASSIKKGRDLDPFRLFIEMRNEDRYLNIIEGKGCRHLGKNNSLNFQQKADNREGLCRGDIFYVSSRMSGVEIGICKLGYFYRLVQSEE